MQIGPPGKKELRQFGIVFAVGFGVLFYLLLPLIFGASLKLWPALVSLFFLLAAFVAPKALKYIYIPWMKLAHVLGRINTTIILSLIFYLLITPLGMIFRLIGSIKDGVVLKDGSYKNPSENKERTHLEKPF